MAIDRVLPRFDVSDRHSIVVRADPERAYAALRSFDLADSWISKILFAIRRARPVRVSHLRLADIIGRGFVVVVEDPGHEIVLGTVGPFWRVFGGGRRTTASDFATYDEPDSARAAMNFRVEPIGDGRTRVSTETRVSATDDRGRRAFRRYWRFIAPGSALIRFEMLRLIKRAAESTAQR